MGVWRRTFQTERIKCMLRLLVPGLLNKQQEAKEAGEDGENCWKRGSRDEKRIVGGQHC